MSHSEPQSVPDQSGSPAESHARESVPAPLLELGGKSSPETERQDLRLSPEFTSPKRLSAPEVAPDLRTPLGWTDLGLLAVFYLVSGAVLYLLVVTGAFLAFGISPSTVQSSAAARSIVLILSQALLSGATLIFLFVLLRGRTVAAFWPSLGWRHFHSAVSKAGMALQYAFGGFGLALLVGFLSRFVGKDSGLPLDEMFRSRLSVLLMMGLGILVAPLVEETIFRGCIYPVIARRFGLPAGVLVTGVLFGLAHAQQLWGGWGQIALLVGVGILLTYVRAQAGTVAASYFVHLGYNTTLFAGFYFATSGLRYIPS